MASGRDTLMDSQAAPVDERGGVQLATADDAEEDGDCAPLLLVRAISDIDSRMKLLEDHADANVDVDVNVNARETPLFHAVRYTDNVSTAKTLLANGAHVNARDNFKETVLHFAASAAMAKLLIENGANVHALNKWGRTPLFRAVRYNRADVVKELISAGADVHVTDKFGQTAMFQINVAGDSVAALEVLVKHGASVQVSSEFMDSPLHRAAVYGKLGAVRFLADHGAPIDVSLAGNHTPLFEAASSGRLDVVKFLLDRGASVHGDPSHRYLPVVPAAINGHLSVIAELLARGAWFDLKQDDPKVAPSFSSSFSGARRLSDIEVLELMIEHCKTIVPARLDVAVIALDAWLSRFVANLYQLPLAFRSLWMQVARKLERLLSRIKCEDDVSTHKTRVMFGVISLRYWKWTLEYSARRAARPQDVHPISRLSPQDMVTICILDREMDEFQLARMVLNGDDFMREMQLGPDGNSQSALERPSDKITALKASVVRWIPGVSRDDDDDEQQPEMEPELDLRRVWMKLLKAALELTQLHKQQIVHGELVARGLQRIRSNNEAQLRAAMKEPPRDPEAVRWKSPESLKGATDTFATDVFTFGMCILEAVSGQVPWGRVSSGVVSVLVGIGRLPKQPECMSNDQWQLVVSMCARDPAARPKMSTVVPKLAAIMKQENSRNNSSQKP